MRFATTSYCCNSLFWTFHIARCTCFIFHIAHAVHFEHVAKNMRFASTSSCYNSMFWTLNTEDIAYGILYIANCKLNIAQYTICKDYAAPAMILCVEHFTFLMLHILQTLLIPCSLPAAAPTSSQSWKVHFAIFTLAHDCSFLLFAFCSNSCQLLLRH